MEKMYSNFYRKKSLECIGRFVVIAYQVPKILFSQWKETLLSHSIFFSSRLSSYFYAKTNLKFKSKFWTISCFAKQLQVQKKFNLEEWLEYKLFQADSIIEIVVYT